MTTDRDDVNTSADPNHSGDDLPPPPPKDAVLTRDIEQQIRQDERVRVERELHKLAADDGRTGVHDRPVEDERRVAATDGAYVAGDRRPTDDTVRDEYLEEEVVRERSFSVGQAITLIVGAALTALGIFTLIETGVETPLNQPVEQVMGFDHTPWLGIGELCAGVLLLLAGLRPGGRWLAALVGAALVAVGVMIVAEMDWTVDELGAQTSYGWIPIVAGALALLGAALTPRRHQLVTETRRVDDDRLEDTGVTRVENERV